MPGSNVWIGVRLPVSVRGLPPGLFLRGEGETRLGVNGKPNRSSLVHEDSRYYLDIYLPRSREDFRGRRVSLRTDLDVWVLNDKPLYKIALRKKGLTKVPHLGLCTLNLSVIALDCWNGPVRLPGTTMELNGQRIGPPAAYHADIGGDAFPYDQLIWDFMPIERRELPIPKEPFFAPRTELSFAQQIAVGRFHAHLTTDNYALIDPSLGWQFKAQ